MRRHVALAAASLLFLVPFDATEALQVRILESPGTVYSYEPVIVVFEVRNDEDRPALIPEYGCRNQGTFLAVGRRGEQLEDQCQVYDLEVRHFAWVAPGERRLFLAHVTAGKEGLFEVEAVVRSSGLCLGTLVGGTRIPLPPVREVEGAGPRFDCWDGESRSETAFVEIRVPTDSVDLEAARFIEIESAKNVSAVLTLKLRELGEKFPTSHYTYAARFAAGGPLGALVGVEDQPGNPLNRWVVSAAAASLARRTRRCAEAESDPFFDPLNERRRLTRAMESYAPPDAASAFLQQLDRDLAAEDCAQSQGDSTGNGGQGGGTKPASESSAPSRRSRRQASSNGWGGASLSGATDRSVEGAFPSTMGFKQRLILSATPGPSIHWLSLPYRYEPEDVGTIGVVDAEDLCQDVGDGGGVTNVLRWNEATSTILEHVCGNPSPFALQAGQAYGIRRTPNWSLSANLAGGHDDSFSFSIPASGASQLSWVSVPYHLRNATSNDPVTAEGLCQQIGTSELLAVVRYDSAAGAYRAYGCGSTFEAPFQVNTVEGFGLVNLGGQTISWQPLHY